MRITALEENLKKLSGDELDELTAALGVVCNKLPEQLVQESRLRTSLNVVKLVKKSRVEGGAKWKQ